MPVSPSVLNKNSPSHAYTTHTYSHKYSCLLYTLCIYRQFIAKKCTIWQGRSIERYIANTMHIHDAFVGRSLVLIPTNQLKPSLPDLSFKRKHIWMQVAGIRVYSSLDSFRPHICIFHIYIKLFIYSTDILISQMHPYILSFEQKHISQQVCVHVSYCISFEYRISCSKHQKKNINNTGYTHIWC